MKNGTPRTIMLVGLVVTLSLSQLIGAQGRGQAPAPPGQAPAGGGRGGGGNRGAQPAGPPQTARTAATVDLTGYWESLVTEDWRWRMKVPDKGDVSSIPVTPAARTAANAWDPAKDEAEGNQCKSYGAAAIMRVPTRVHISWESDNVLKLETDAGTQTRLFRFGAAVPTTAGERSWQGNSVAEWEPTAGGGRGGGGGGGGAFPGGGPGGPPALAATAPVNDDAAPITLPPGAPAVGARGGGGAGGRGGNQPGDLKVITANMKAGYLRKNGVPYSEKAVVTEYFNRTGETYGITYLVVTTIVEDPDNLTGPFITSSHFKKLPDTANGWDPSMCSVR